MNGNSTLNESHTSYDEFFNSELPDIIAQKVVQQLYPLLQGQSISDSEIADLIYKQDAMKKYHFSASTAQKWQQRKIITPYKLGKKVWYKESELRQAIGIAPPNIKL